MGNCLKKKNSLITDKYLFEPLNRLMIYTLMKPKYL